jgi:hypothetical protein
MASRRVSARKRGNQVSRRDFLKTSGLAAGAALAAQWLPGCVTGIVPEPTPAGPREKRTLHFDFSKVTLSQLWLSAPLSPQHQAPLQVHDDTSRARFRALNGALGDVPDERLTHYIENVDLPANNLQHLRVFGRTVATGADALAAAYIHVPLASLQRLAQCKAAKGQTGKLRRYGLSLDRAQSTTPAQVLDFVDPFQTATTLVFHDPDIMSLDPDLGAEIIDLIQNSPCDPNDNTCTESLATLAAAIDSNWPASTTGGWATLTQAADQNGVLQYDSRGNPVYNYTLSGGTLAALQEVVPPIKHAIFSNSDFGPSTANPAGGNYHPQTSTTAVDVTPSQSPQGALGDSSVFQIVPRDGVGSSHHGLKYVQIAATDPTNKTTTVTIKNAYLRFVAAYAQCYDAAGNSLAPPQPNPSLQDDPNQYNSSRAYWLGMMSSNDTILGVPLVGDDISSTTFTFNAPQDAASFDLLFASLGVGGEAFSPEAVYPSIMTIIFNCGIPSMLLALGVGEAVSSIYNSLWKTVGPEVLDAVVAALKSEKYDIGLGIYSGLSSGTAKEFLIQAGSVGVNVVISSSPAIAARIGTEVAAQTLVDAAPIVGLVTQLLGLAAGASVIAQSVGEICTNPAIYRNWCQLTMDTQLSINHDPNDSGFPSQAARYDVTATYDKSIVGTTSGSIAGGTVGPVVATLSGVPAGGMVTYDVKIYSSDNWLVGAATLGPIANSPSSTGQVSVTITEYAIPLTSHTQYVHGAILEYSNKQRQWNFGAPAAPTATVNDLSTRDTAALWGLNGVTLAQKLGMLGYGFDAGGQGVPSCLGSGVIVNTIQNVFNKTNPESALKFSSCGTPAPMAIVYDKLGDANGKHFFLQQAADGNYDLHQAVLDNATDFNMQQLPASWGRFVEPMTAMAIHPSGVILGVARDTSTLHVLDLPNAPGDPLNSPVSVPYASIKCGQGQQLGRLDTPVGIAVSTLDGTVFVLEQGTARVQAFNRTGANALPFGGNASFALQKESGANYLDIAVEGMNFIYILSYTNGGAAPSDYHLDVYTPTGTFLCRTSGVAAARMAVDTFRNVYVANYAVLAGSPRVEPSLSQWYPNTPP